jgi:TonB family protein
MKSKIKIMKAKPEVNDDEIRSFMDFDKLLIQREEVFARSSKRILRTTGLVVIGMIVVSAIWFFVIPVTHEPPKQDSPQQKSPEKITPEKSGATQSQTDTSVVASTRPLSEARKDVESKKVIEPSHVKSGTIDSSSSVSAQPEPTETEALEPAVYVQAEPEAGYPALYEYFTKELTYPATALKDSIQGVVSVAFTIGKDGRPERISVEQSLGAAFDEEAIRLIRNMPVWRPATYNGKPVASRMSVPLTFQIKKLTTR